MPQCLTLISFKSGGDPVSNGTRDILCVCVWVGSELRVQAFCHLELQGVFSLMGL